MRVSRKQEITTTDSMGNFVIISRADSGLCTLSGCCGSVKSMRELFAACIREVEDEAEGESGDICDMALRAGLRQGDSNPGAGEVTEGGQP